MDQNNKHQLEGGSSENARDNHIEVKYEKHTLQVDIRQEKDLSNLNANMYHYFTPGQEVDKVYSDHDNNLEVKVEEHLLELEIKQEEEVTVEDMYQHMADNVKEGDMIPNDHDYPMKGGKEIHQIPIDNMAAHYQASAIGNNQYFYTEMPYQCSQCKISFDRKQSLFEHQRKHTDKSFQCSLCGSRWANKCYLEKHMLKHKMKNTENPYPCSHCDKCFPSWSGMVHHAKRHTGEMPYQCRHCGKGFTMKTNMKKHELIHTSLDPYQCRHCGKGFTMKTNMKKHELIHTKDKTYDFKYLLPG